MPDLRQTGHALTFHPAIFLAKDFDTFFTR